MTDREALDKVEEISGLALHNSQDRPQMEFVIFMYQINDLVKGLER